ncbi:HEAT repeat domain-containing protein, partial [Microcoleus sp. N9_A2]
YAFYHATFQEYFAALAVDDWDYFLPRNHVDFPVVGKEYRIFEAQWKQVILLWLGRGEIERKHKQKFIDALVNFEDGCGEWGVLYILDRWEHLLRVEKGFYEYRTYFLAVAAIAEFQDYSQIDEIIRQIVKWRFGYFDTQKQKWVKFFNVISNAAMEALQQTHRPKAIDALVERLNSRDLRDYIRGEVAASLGKIGQGNQKAIDALVQQLNSPALDHFTLWEASLSLDKIASGNQKAIAALEQLLKLNLDDSARCLVPVTLGYIDPGNQNAIAALEQLLNSSILDDDSGRQVAVILKEIDPDNPKVIDALEQLLTSPALNDDTRREVAASLGKIDPGNQNAIDTLVQQLISSAFDEEYDSTSRQVAVMLEEIGQGNQTAIDALVQLLISPDLNNYTRGDVAESLGEIAQGNQKAIAALEQQITSPAHDDDTRREVSASLGKIDPGNQKAIDALEQLLTSSNYIRREVAESLGNIDPGNQKAIDALVQLLNLLHLDDVTRWLVAESLGEIDPGNQKAIDALVQLLNSLHRNDLTFLRVIQSLGKIGQDNQTAIDALIQILNSPALDNYTCGQVAASLKKMNIKTEKQFAVITTLKAKFNDSQQVDKNCYELIWHYGENLPYSDFYRAWHGLTETQTSPLVQTLNLAQLPQLLQTQLTETNLHQNLQIFCIDTSKFIDTDNPALEIYEQFLNQNCPQRPNGEPETLPQLKSYWNQLRRDSDQHPILIFYEDPTSPASQGLSPTFLNALTRFDGTICLIADTPHPPLQTFSPHDSDLLQTIMSWLQHTILEA